MSKKPRAVRKAVAPSASRRGPYDQVLGGIVDLLESARRASARVVNTIMTATYWEVGRRIVEGEQRGRGRAVYGEDLLRRLSVDLSRRFGRGFSRQNLQLFRLFYTAYQESQICQTLSGKLPAGENCQTLSGKFAGPEGARKGGLLTGKSARQLRPSETSSSAALARIASAQSGLIVLGERFPLPWSHYVRLLSVRDSEARAFYEAEALRCGWSVRQLDRQVSTLFYERTAMSRDKASMLRKGERPRAGEALSPEQAIKDPLVLEFLDLKDEYSENDLEEALTRELESFLMELGGDFTFVARQRRLRVGGEWYRIDLLFFHRRLRCLVVIDLNIGKFTHADAGQMHLYLNYARENWMLPGENPPVGLILCTAADQAVARYALDGLPNRVLAGEYRTALPTEKALAAEISRARRLLEARTTLRPRRAKTVH